MPFAAKYADKDSGLDSKSVVEALSKQIGKKIPYPIYEDGERFAQVCLAHDHSVTVKWTTTREVDIGMKDADGKPAMTESDTVHFHKVSPKDFQKICRKLTGFKDFPITSDMSARRGFDDFGNFYADWTVDVKDEPKLSALPVKGAKSD